MQGAECAAEGLKGRDHLGILSVSASFKIAECDDFDQIEQRDRFLPSRFIQLSIEISPYGQELLTEPFLLVIASTVEIGAIVWAGYPREAVLSTAWAADQSSEGRTRAFAFSMVAI